MFFYLKIDYSELHAHLYAAENMTNNARNKHISKRITTTDNGFINGTVVNLTCPSFN